jgi:hypothetical protein
MPALEVGQIRKISKADEMGNLCLHRLNSDEHLRCGTPVPPGKSKHFTFAVLRFTVELPKAKLCTHAACFG